MGTRGRKEKRKKDWVWVGVANKRIQKGLGDVRRNDVRRDVSEEMTWGNYQQRGGWGGGEGGGSPSDTGTSAMYS